MTCALLYIYEATMYMFIYRRKYIYPRTGYVDMFRCTGTVTLQLNVSVCCVVYWLCIQLSTTLQVYMTCVLLYIDIE